MVRGWLGKDAGGLAFSDLDEGGEAEEQQEDGKDGSGWDEHDDIGDGAEALPGFDRWGVCSDLIPMKSVDLANGTAEGDEKGHEGEQDEREAAADAPAAGDDDEAEDGDSQEGGDGDAEVKACLEKRHLREIWESGSDGERERWLLGIAGDVRFFRISRWLRE